MDTEYVDAVLDVVDLVPPGCATTYGDVAAVVVSMLGRGGPRLVGTALREGGGAVAWWRVVRADGDPPAHKRAEALALLREEGCPIRGGGRVDLARARADLRALVAAAESGRELAGGASHAAGAGTPLRKEMDVTGRVGE
ncbi:MGMT family protein [Sanguibacter sp. A247]|uniref:MGMT family protein n=1 Tax=unclassified Sanguibacter TaxID=2645534 RepID=UPI003FD8FB56